MSSNNTNDIPSDAIIQMMAPDGYYKYFDIPKTITPPGGTTSSTTTTTIVDDDIIKKKYRKLSLKHHPDKRGGDADTFRVLNRAYKVLLHPKLRQQYDNLGLDLDDDDDAIHNNDDQNSSNGNPDDEQTTTQGIVHEIASMALTNVLQLGVRTVMMAVVSILIVRYRWLMIPALLFLSYIAFRIHSAASSGVVGASSSDVISPCLIGLGLLLMHQAAYTSQQQSSDVEQSTSWMDFMLFWIGESLVIGMFTYNSVSTSISSTTNPLVVYAGISIVSTVASLIVRGKFWNYIMVIGLEVFLAIFIAISFPVMEMVLEAVLNDKLKKVGEKVRQHHIQVEKYYEYKTKQLQQQLDQPDHPKPFMS